MTDCISAIFASIAQVFVGHPFDTAKTLIQNKKSFLNLSFKEYYRGYRFPLISATLVNGILFPVYERTLPYTNSGFLSGLLGGSLISPIIYLFDTGKIRRQTQQPLSYSNFIYGKGKLSVFSRETTAFSIYFGVYTLLKERDVNMFLAGSLSGLANWTVTYPIDVVKSRQISQNVSIPQAIRMGNLWKGYSICAIRSVFVNAAVFGTYESVSKFLQ